MAWPRSSDHAFESRTDPSVCSYGYGYGLSQQTDPPHRLVVHPPVKANNVEELVALAKSSRGQLNYGPGGNGGAANLVTGYFKLQTGTSMPHIPHRGMAPAVIDLMGGQIQVLFTVAPAVLSQVKNGHLRVLAVSSPQVRGSLARPAHCGRGGL